MAKNDGKIDPSECPKCLPGWLAAFGDLMSLLLCFFVLLLSMSSMDPKKIEDAIGSLAGALSVLEGGMKTELSRDKQQQDNPVKKDKSATDAKSTLRKIQQNLNEINEMLQAVGSPQAHFKESEDGFIIQLPASLLFSPYSVDIKNEDALLFLRRIALIIDRMPSDISLNIIGYTDNTPLPRDVQFKDQWQLSTQRALSVGYELIKANVNPQKFIISGRGEFDPIASNATEEGRAKNRRVELHFYSTNKNTQKEAQQSVLDSAVK